MPPAMEWHLRAPPVLLVIFCYDDVAVPDWAPQSFLASARNVKMQNKPNKCRELKGFSFSMRQKSTLIETLEVAKRCTKNLANHFNFPSGLDNRQTSK
jgi:hypothetical protein